MTESVEHSEPAPDGVATALAAIEAQLVEFNRRAAHREAVIDRLHEENTELKQGLRRVVLEPVVTDLLRMCDGLGREARHHDEEEQTRVAKFLRTLVDDISLVLDRCGYTLLSDEEVGEPFQRGRHSLAELTPTDDPARHDTVAAVVAYGLIERDSGQIRRPAKTRIYRLADARTTPESE